ncbi:HicB family protein [Candidatus Wolfebacteria bacterium CG03_land_8_20_14_0_80_36_15]|uniref:HicB family protein n=1 Tax=Candidatus Wolfebacteria bacterium CG03_land_8_20_14_0_80_36_15 TaxID=1975067 RepID=A0A2M7B8J5_9BACT|nr:MAG: HicB family protein [Candidatus Wolfebacteria bacterium CG03_land_8_20_14_0_80_36_15]
MLTEFINKKLKEAQYKILKDRTYFGEIPGLKGVWASAKNLEDCRKELQEVLEDWLLLKIKTGDYVPGFRTKIGERLLTHA